jgi:hypothetical protein
MCLVHVTVNSIISIELIFIKMKKIKKLHLNDIVEDTVNIDQLSEIEIGMILGGYGCESNVCSQNWTGAPCDTNSDMCKNYVCTSGVAG